MAFDFSGEVWGPRFRLGFRAIALGHGIFWVILGGGFPSGVAWAWVWGERYTKTQMAIAGALGVTWGNGGPHEGPGSRPWVRC